jgi:hypothetical protein
MKNDPLTGTLIGVLAVSVLASIVLFYMYVGKTRDLRQVQALVNMISTRRPYIVQMINEVGEYSKTHPAIDPILESAGLKAKSGAAGTPVAPPAKSATK